ncbi:MAG: hypothetical protein E3J30_04570 [Anaerolineales bacterium]|nr:MAG: hypothetical protein E3J30_04570 [Anaerolineales bacterium]
MFRKPAVLITMVLFGVLISSSAAFAQASPYLVASPNHDWVDGHDWPEESSIDLYIDQYNDLDYGDLHHASGSIPEGENWINFELQGEFDLQAGQYVTLTDGTIKKTLLISNLEVTGVNPVTDIVSGTAESGSEVHLWIEGCGDPCDVIVTADSGAWSVDFSPYELDLGTWYPAEQEDDDGDRTQVPWLVPNPRFDANVTGNWIAANEYPTSTDVTVSVYEADLTTLRFAYTQSTDQFGNAWFDFWEQGLEPGNYVVATADLAIFTKDHVIEDLTLDVFDPDADVISGTAPVDATVRVDVCAGDDCESLTVFPDSSGNWIADEWSIDVTPGAWYAAFISDEDGDSTMAELGEPPPMPFFEANITGNWIAVNEFPTFTEVTVYVHESELPSALRFETTEATNDWGHAWFDFWELGLGPLEPWNFVEVVGGGYSKELIILPLTLDIFDPDGDIISGVAPDGETVRVDACNQIAPDEWDCSSEEDIAAGGTWSVSFESFDLLPDSWYAAFITDEDGDSTTAELPPPPSMGIWPIEDRAEGWGWPLDAEITLSIDDPGTGPGQDYGDVQTVVPAEWNPDETIVYFEFADLYDVKAGDIVSMTGEGKTKTYVVTSLEVTSIDPEFDTVSGTADAGTRVDIWYCDDLGCVNRHEDVDFLGLWTADFAIPGDEPDEGDLLDIDLGTWMDVAQWDEDGDGTWISVYVPDTRIQAWPEYDFVEGFEWEDGALVHLEIYASPDPGAELLNYSIEYSGPAPWDPMTMWVGFELPETDLDFGHFIRMWDETTTKEHTVQYVETISAAPEFDEVYGLAEPYSVVRVIPHDFWEGEIYPTADPDGNWTAYFSGIYDVAPGSGFSIVREDDDGDGTWIDWWVPMHIIEVFDGVKVFDATPNSSVTITIYNSQEDLVFGPESRPTDDRGNHYSHYTTLGCHFMLPGDFVVVTDDATSLTKTLLVSELQIENIDADTDIITGRADPGAIFVLHVDDLFGGFEMDVFADDVGNWTADFGSQDYDIPPGALAHAWLGDEDGDVTMHRLPNTRSPDYVRVLPFIGGAEYTVCPGQAARVNWGWTEITPENVDAFVTAIDQHTYTLDGDLLLSTPDSQTLWGPLEPRGPNEGCGWDASWVRWWEYEIVDLEPGDHSLTTFLSLGQPAPQMCGGEGEVSGILWENLTVFLNVVPGPNDADADGVDDDIDNCPGVPNRDQADFDLDGVGDKCDSCPAEDASGQDADMDGCIDTPEGLVDFIDTRPDDEILEKLLTSLISKVENALKSRDKGRENAAIGQLEAFIHQVEAQSGKKINEDIAQMLILYAQNLIQQISMD